MKFIIPVLMISALSVPCLSEESSKSLEAEVELGFLTTTGNTETTSLKAKFDVKKDYEHWLHQLIGDGFYKQDEVQDNDRNETQTTAQKYFLSLKSDYKINRENASLFMFISYTDDRFSGFEYQTSYAMGYSDAVFKSDRTHLTYSIGPGYSVYKEDPEEGQNEGDTEEEFIVYLSGEYQVKLSETSKFKQRVTSDYSLDQDSNSKTVSETSLSAKINGSMALKVSYTLTYNSEVAIENENLDTETAVTLSYTF